MGMGKMRRGCADSTAHGGGRLSDLVMGYKCWVWIG